MDNIQTNTRSGALTLKSENLTGKEGLLAKMTENGVALPAALTDDVPYVVVDGGETESGVKPMCVNDQVRIFLKGTCKAGDKLVLAAIATDAGKVAAIPAAAGTYNVVGIAEEDGVDGQAVLVRPYNKTVTK